MVQLITSNNNVGSFQSMMESGGGWGTQGVHSVGHFTINGDPGTFGYIRG